MNPLSPFTYYRRHLGSAALLVALVTLTTIGLYVMVGVLDSIPMRGHTSYLTKVSLVFPTAADSLDPAVVSRIQTHEGVSQVLPDNGLFLSPPTLIGLDSLRLMGVRQEDTPFLMAQSGVRLKEGRILQPRTNEIMLSEEIVRALGLELGDTIDRSVNERYYGELPAPVALVGILEGDPAAGPRPSARVGLASYEYLESHELFAPRRSGLLVVAAQDRKELVDEFLETVIRSANTEVLTFREVSQLVATGVQMLRVVSGFVNCLVAVVVALVVGVVNRIALARRLEEFGLLHAVGHQRRSLVRRLTLETAAVAGIGWLVGLALAQLALSSLRAGFYYHKGMELDLTNLAPLWFTLPIPAVVVAFAWRSAGQIFARLDSVSIIERRTLGLEQGGGQAGARSAARSSSIRPLSARTFYRRHRSRGVMLGLSMTLMILGVALPVFLLSTLYDAMEPSYEYLRHLSTLSPAAGRTVDPTVTAQIRNHPAVSRVIPAISLGLRVSVPPAGSTEVAVYGVAEDDLPPLLAVLGMDLVAGRLPRAQSNEIVISEAVARNRGLRLGDLVGGTQGDEDLLLGSDDIPAEGIVVGLLSRDDLWLGFASLDYLTSHELTASRPVGLLVVPKAKSDLDAWLEESVASAGTEVKTFNSVQSLFRETRASLFLLLAAVESIIAFVAATALAALNTIFFAQRREEFGILHAVGRSRLWLILRSAKESGSVIALAWLLGALVSVAALLSLGAAVYAPRGLSLDLADPVPWLFTLPIPLAVVAVGTAITARTLFRLDPVSIVERRS
jgi:ABC-type lipoprotein release transport system permease subunit